MLDHALADDVRPLCGVDVVAETGEVEVEPLVDDGRGGKTQSTAQEQVVCIGGFQCLGVGLGALGNRLAGNVVAADTLIEAYELLRADNSRSQRRETVLDADVVERASYETRNRITAELVHQLLRRRALDAGRIRDRVVSC